MTGSGGAAAEHARAEPPLVSVVIPCRNEAADIGRCVEHLAAQDLALDRIEVLVVDGGSTDATAEIARAAVRGVGFARAEVLDNPTGTTPSNLNAGLAAARGTYLCRVDARSLVPPAYARTCAEVLAERADVTVVGGAQVAVAPRPGAVGEGIARALNNRWAMGLSRYRSGAVSGPADTVYLGAFRTDELRDAGGWDESLGTNQDFELNRRMGRRGIVWFDDRLPVGYVPRSNLPALLRQYHRFGRWKVRYWRTTGDRPRPRQVALLVGAGLGSVAGAALLVRRPALTAAVGTAALLAVDAAAGPAGDVEPRARLAAAGAMACTTMGWVSGVTAGLLSGDP